MGFSFGPGFDSPQLHDKTTLPPAREVFVFRANAELAPAFANGNKKTIAKQCGVVLQDGSKGNVSEANTPRNYPKSLIAKAPVCYRPQIQH